MRASFRLVAGSFKVSLFLRRPAGTLVAGGDPVSEEWIEKLASGIKIRDHAFAETYVKERNDKAVIVEKGPAYFQEVVKCLTRYVDEFNAALAGDVTAFPTRISHQPMGQLQKRWMIYREAFPQVDARLLYVDDHITLSKEGASEIQYEFSVGANNGLSIREQFGQNAQSFGLPCDFARYLMESLFS
jgi:hypothetical protein